MVQRADASSRRGWRQFQERFEEFAHEGGYGEVATRGANASLAGDFVGNARGDIAHVF